MPFTSNFSELFESLRNTGGLERIMDFIFLGTGAANGYDALGHFLRAEGVGNGCLDIRSRALLGRGLQAQAVQQQRHRRASAGDASRAPRPPSASTTSVLMARTLAVIKGATPAQALAQIPGPARRARAKRSRRASTSGSTDDRARSRSAARPRARPTTRPPREGSEAGGLLLNYLLGSE